MCLDSIIANDYPKDRLEVLVVDGMNEDGTRLVVNDYVLRYEFIRLVDNPKKITPAALNTGIRNAKGKIIMLMGVHATYPANYVSGLVSWLEVSGADCVGEILVTLPGGDSPMAQAIALALAHPFGVGSALFRIGTAKPRWVDTVAFGCYQREVFDRVGLFDEELARNQDDQFNHRLIKRGGRILLIPEIVSYYYARDSLMKLWRMYYQYGYFKPLVVRKIGKVMTAQQLIPTLFILALVGSAAVAPLFWPMRLVLSAVLVTYSAADVAALWLRHLGEGLDVPSRYVSSFR